MANDANFLRPASDLRLVTEAALDPGQVMQLADGRCGVLKSSNGAAANDTVTPDTTGQFTMLKATGVVLLNGGRAYWDHSANVVTFRKVNDRDFYVGRVVGDAASGDTTCTVNINIPEFDGYTIDLLRDAALSVPTGTVAAGGFDLPKKYGGASGLSLTATNEAQCIDMLSVDRVAISANGIAEFIVRLGANGSTSAVDLNIGVANGTSTTDADAITESVFFHIDGGALDLFAESDDGTTEVAATDTTVNVTAGSAVSDRFECWIDLRNPADIQLYVNGANVLPATVFTLAAATGPIGLLVHLEKTSGTATAGPVYVDFAAMRTAQQ